MRDYPQFEDLGLNPEADRTEDLRSKQNGPRSSGVTSTGGDRLDPTISEEQKGAYMKSQNPHPVDSTFHACCNAIGGHGRGCTETGQANADDWREFVDELTYEQIGRLLNAEDANGADVAVMARRFVDDNRLTTQRLSYLLPTPVDARTVCAWDEDDERPGGLLRRFDGTYRAVDDRCGVLICGVQRSDGRVEREITVDSPGLRDGFSSAVARSIAEALIEAADELERLQ